MQVHIEQLQHLVRQSICQINGEKPSQWIEKNVFIPKEPFPGQLSFKRSPYTREIVDRLSPDDPARYIGVKKGAQIGFSTTVIYAGMMWLIRNNPGNSVLTVGSPDLIKGAMNRIDGYIDNSGNRDLIGSQSRRVKNQKTGDTNDVKEFPNGFIKIFNAANHNNIRQDDYKYGFFDDFEAIKTSSEKDGNTMDLLIQRFASYGGNRAKIYFISTPQLKSGSNIEVAFLLGDQRYFNIPCPVCNELIVLKWEHEGGGGMVWDLDNHGNVVESSVGYCCPKCAGFFKDNKKYEMLNNGVWIPTATPFTSEHTSYQISSLYAPVGMTDWKHYVNQYVKANPKSGRVESSYKTFVNVVEGLCYDAPSESPKATQIMKNIRSYRVGVVPHEQSLKDGNGRIVFLTAGADMNGVAKGLNKGTEDDGRLDVEILAHSENGATYSILQRSIGTFIPKEGAKINKEDRAKWTYGDTKQNNIWVEFDKLLATEFPSDDGSKPMKVYVAGLDCGYLDKLALSYIDRTNNRVIGLKGDKEHRYMESGVDVSRFQLSQSSNKLWTLRVGLYKDMLADYMCLNWDKNADSQPSFFMNFPQPEEGMYSYERYFEHFESEERKVVEDKNGKVIYRWVKKPGTQNHFFDCRIYNLAVLDIVMHKVCLHAKIKKPTWGDFVDLLKKHT